MKPEMEQMRGDLVGQRMEYERRIKKLRRELGWIATDAADAGQADIARAALAALKADDPA